MKVTDVDVSKLSDSELDELLKRVDEEELPEHTDYPEPEPEVYGSPEGVETAPPPAAEASTQPKAKDPVPVAPPKKEPEIDESAKITPPPIDPTLKALYDKIEGLEKRLSEQAAPQPTGQQQPLNIPEPKPIEPEKFFENPDAIIEQKMVEHQARKNAIQEMQIREFNRKTDETKKQVLTLVPDFEQFVPEMASYLKTQGVDAGLVEAFSQNPYAAQNTPMLRMLADIARERKLRADLEAKRQPVSTVTPPPQENLVVKPGNVRPNPGHQTLHSDMSKYTDDELRQIIEKGRLS